MKKKIIDLKLYLSVIAVCTTMAAGFGYVDPLLGWNAEKFHFWQLLTCHFMHYDLKHLFTNMLALGILLYIFPATRILNILGVGFAILLIDLYLWIAEESYYVGYSGLLYAIPGIAFAKYISQKRYALAVFIAAIYILYTLVTLDVINESKGLIWRPLSQVHLLGFIGGMLSLFVITCSRVTRVT